MNAEPLTSAPLVFPLRRRGQIALYETGLRHPRFFRWLGEAFTPYGDVTHHSVTSRVFRLATRRSVTMIPRAAFADPRAPDELARALVERIGRQPGGQAQLDRMWEVEKRSAAPRPVRLGASMAAACAVVGALQLLLGPLVSLVGSFSTALFLSGEPWRLVTANLLHGGLGHLALNALGLVAIGGLVERILGTARTALVMGLSALGAMGAGALAGYQDVVGASGVVFGLVGALFWLEMRHGADLPAGWRVPRGLLIAALVAEAVLSLTVPFIAGAAHAGGFGAGIAAGALVTEPALRRERAAPWLLAANSLLAFAVATSLAASGWMIAAGGHTLARHAESLLDRANVPPLLLNNTAWVIVTDPGSGDREVEVALRLAERAVRETQRREPNFLDTLAEAQFVAGQPKEAIRTIDEAIALAPQVSYFAEQRRRFTGERDPADRPDPPLPGETLPLPDAPPPPARPGASPPDDGLRV